MYAGLPDLERLLTNNWRAVLLPAAPQRRRGTRGVHCERLKMIKHWLLLLTILLIALGVSVDRSFLAIVLLFYVVYVPIKFVAWVLTPHGYIKRWEDRQNEIIRLLRQQNEFVRKKAGV